MVQIVNKVSMSHKLRKNIVYDHEQSFATLKMWNKIHQKSIRQNLWISKLKIRSHAIISNKISE